MQAVLASTSGIPGSKIPGCNTLDKQSIFLGHSSRAWKSTIMIQASELHMSISPIPRLS
jgi:hypothetical protein